MPDQSIDDGLDANDVVAEAIMMRAAEDKCMLLVEGHGDKKILSCFIDLNCDIIVCRGKDYTLSALYELKDRGLEGVVCIVDSDFDRLLNVSVANDNVIVTSENDLDIIIFRSPAFGRVILELGSGNKAAAFAEAGHDTRDYIRDIAHLVGIARYISRRDELNLKFEGMRYRFVDRNMNLSISDMITEIVNNSQAHHLCRNTMKDNIEAFSILGDARWSFCQGHDLATLFGKALQAKLGNLSAALSKGEIIEGYLRVGFSPADFVATSVFADLQAWEARNPEYRCLNPALAA